MLYDDLNSVMNSLIGVFEIKEDGKPVVLDKIAFRERLDELVYNAVFSKKDEIKEVVKWIIWEGALEMGLFPSTIQGFYEAKGRGEYSHITVPAVNIRGLTYDVARALVRAAMRNRSRSFIFELARTEMSYTDQPPSEYATVVMAAALKEGYTGPIFIQGDHFQIKPKLSRDEEIEAVKDLIRDSVSSGFYNIDIDTSTLVDLRRESVREQQRDNFEVASELASFIRRIEPEGITISIGGEIGEVGGKNSTEEELREFLNGFIEELQKKGKDLKGLSKVSIQTGTTHGGIPLPDGRIAKVKIDFDTLERLSRVAIQEYGLAGAVQHGASTLPEEAFNKFAEVNTAEVHLATEFQNMIYESELFPKDLKKEMYEWLRRECAGERKEGETDEQFFYKTRKKAFGPFKDELWNMEKGIRDGISKMLEDKFDLLFKRLGAINTWEAIEETVRPVVIHKTIPESLKGRGGRVV